MKRALILLGLLSVGSVQGAAAAPVRVACIGDSITYGTAMTNRVAECYPAVLQRLLGSGYEVRNFGDPGAGVYEHTRWGDRPRAWRLRDEYAKALAFRPDIIVSNLGINDAVEFVREFATGDGALARGTFRDRYVSLLESFRREGRLPRIVMWSRLGPTGKKHALKGKPNAALMERDLDEVARRVGAETIDMLAPLVPFVETDGFAADGIHPEGRAQRVIAERTAARLDLNAAIARTAAAGGGRVTVPAGRHFSAGPIVLRSNVELRLDDEAVVEFSDRVDDYLPGVPVSWEGNECVNVSPLVYAYGCTNVAITGRGVFKPRLEFWRTWFGRRDEAMNRAVDTLKNRWAEHDAPVDARQLWKLPGAKFRPQFFHFNRCRDVRLEDFRAVGTPFWMVHFFLCEGVTVRGLDLDAYDDFGHWLGNSDGIDLECTRNVLVENCTFRQHDDAIVIKSGKDRDGRRLATPTENVVVRDCVVRGGPTFVAIGSELSGGIRNVRVANCRVTGETGQLVHVKTNPRRGGFVDGVTVENVVADRVRRDLVNVETDYFYGCPGEERLARELTTAIGNLTFRNLRAKSARRCLYLAGDPKRPLEGVTVENVTADRCAEPDVRRNVNAR